MGPGRDGNGNGNGHGGNGYGAGGPGVPAGMATPSVSPRRESIAVAPTHVSDVPAIILDVPGDVLPRVAPAEPVPTYDEPPDLVTVAGAGGELPEEPPLPDEARARAASAAQAPSRPVEAAPGAVLNVRFARDAGPDRLVTAMEAFKSILRERPGGTRVVVHVPAPGGSALPMELRPVAYDAELVAEVRRRVGDGVIELTLA